MRAYDYSTHKIAWRLSSQLLLYAANEMTLEERIKQEENKERTKGEMNLKRREYLMPRKHPSMNTNAAQSKRIKE